MNTLISSDDPAIRALSVTVIVRQREQGNLLARKGIAPVILEGLDDKEGLIRLASEHDIVINVANGFHEVAAKALIEGLGAREKETNSNVHYIHVSNRQTQLKTLTDLKKSCPGRPTSLFQPSHRILSNCGVCLTETTTYSSTSSSSMRMNRMDNGALILA